MEVIKAGRRRQRRNLLVDACSESDGVNDQAANIPTCGLDLFNLQRDETFTFAFWIKSGGVNGETVFSRWLVDGINSHGYKCYFLPFGELFFQLGSNILANQQVKSISAIPKNEWVHIIITYDGTNPNPATGIQMYVNGIDDSTNYTQSISGTINYANVNFRFWAVNTVSNDLGGQGNFLEGRMFMFQGFQQYINAAAAADLYNQAQTKAERFLGFSNPPVSFSMQHYENFGAVANLFFMSRVEESARGHLNALGFVQPIGGFSIADVVKDAPEHGS